MASKPYFGQAQYKDKNKSFEENYGNYQRDLLLWEQAEAMEKQNEALQQLAYQQKQQEIQQHISDVFSREPEPLSEEERLELFADENEFKEGSELYNKFEILLNKYNKYKNITYHLDNSFLIITLLLILSVSWIVAIINPKTIPYIILALVINIIALLIIKHIRISAKCKADALRNKMLEMKIKNKTELETYEPDELDKSDNYNMEEDVNQEKLTNKPKEVLTLEHKE